eukprot:973814-Rhodomonas_salina.5
MALRYVLRAAGTEGLYGARVGHSLMPSRTTASYWQCNVCRYKPLTPVLIVPLVLRTSGTDKVDAAMVGCYQCSVLSRAVVGGGATTMPRTRLQLQDAPMHYTVLPSCIVLCALRGTVIAYSATRTALTYSATRSHSIERAYGATLLLRNIQY